MSRHNYSDDDLATMRFKAGIDSYLNMLLARNALFSAQRSLGSLKLAFMQNEVTLYKAQSGGWRENARGPG
jgi:multidrug efflux system outer membrane protein